jgi:hypothetical protein
MYSRTSASYVFYTITVCIYSYNFSLSNSPLLGYSMLKKHIISSSQSFYTLNASIRLIYMGYGPKCILYKCIYAHIYVYVAVYTYAYTLGLNNIYMYIHAYNNVITNMYICTYVSHTHLEVQAAYLAQTWTDVMLNYCFLSCWISLQYWRNLRFN